LIAAQAPWGARGRPFLPPDEPSGTRIGRPGHARRAERYARPGAGMASLRMRTMALVRAIGIASR